jgi:hypothetical protein
VKSPEDEEVLKLKLGAELSVLRSPAAIPADKVKVQVIVDPADKAVPPEFVSVLVPSVQLTEETPVLGVATDMLVTDIPDGKVSFTVTEVPDVRPPLLPILNVNVSTPPDGLAADFAKVNDAGSAMVVDTFVQVDAVPPDVAQFAPGVGGDDPPVGSIDA